MVKPVSAIVISVEDQAIKNLALDIKKAWDMEKRATKEALSFARKVGTNLALAKKKVPHGKWLDFLKNDVRMPESTAQYRMQIADQWPILEPEILKNPDFGIADARRLLSSLKGEQTQEEPSNPSRVRDLETNTSGELSPSVNRNSEPDNDIGNDESSDKEGEHSEEASVSTAAESPVNRIETTVQAPAEPPPAAHVGNGTAPSTNGTSAGNGKGEKDPWKKADENFGRFIRSMDEVKLYKRFEAYITEINDAIKSRGRR